MKLNISHLFLILFGTLILSHLGFSIKEGLKVKELNIDKITSDEEIDDDSYILKTNLIPPICPKCPDVKSCPRNTPCPPCPACARCPESAFTCKKSPRLRKNRYTTIA